MATARTDAVTRLFRRAVLRQDAAEWTDGHLLASFIRRQDGAAFAALVRRHGPMVLGVCRRILRHHHDAEDAFQATFLVLARKASSVQPRERLANWLHGVALRTALKAKAMTAKRRGRERQVAEMPEPEAARPDQWRDLQPLLDQELHGLPEHYRLPILRCDLGGQAIKEAARQLGWPQGTLAGRLARGRRLLARRLASRGVVLSAGSLAAVVSQHAASAAVPAPLMGSTVTAAVAIAAGPATAAGAVPARVAILTDGVLNAMVLSKLKTATAGLLLIALLCGTAGAVYKTQAAEQPKEDQTARTTTAGSTAEAGKEKHQTPKKNLEGVWAVVSVEDTDKNRLDFDPIFSYAAGTQAPVRTARLALGGGGFALKTGVVSLEGWYSCDASANGIVLTIHPDGDDGLLSLRGVYSLDGDTLTISFGDVPASQVAALAGRKPGVCYTLRRESPPRKEAGKERAGHAAEKGITDPKAAGPQVPPPPKAAGRREYVILSRLLEAGADRPKAVLGFPKVTVADGQRVPVHITDGPQNLLAKVLAEEQIRIGTLLAVRVNRLGGNKVRLFLSCQRNELAESSVREIRVLGHSVQVIQDVELQKPVKVVLQQDAGGSARRWVEITVDEQAVPDEPTPPAPAASDSPLRQGGKR
jgi:RNA polymerase sigma factor (sigma-70 family)